MRGKLIFIAGLGVGYVLGARAGRERFDRMVGQARRMWESPAMQEAAGVFQAKANHLYDQGKQAVSHRVGRSTGRAEKSAGTGETTESEDSWDAAARRRQFSANAF